MVLRRHCAFGDIPCGGVEAVDGVGIGGSLDIGRDLLANRWVDGIVDEVDVEARGIGAVEVSRLPHAWVDCQERNILNRSPLHNHGA